MQTESLREARKQIYSCTFCSFIQEAMDVHQLEPIDERKYIFHLKQSHSLVP